ncbi:YbaN family protein [Pseudobdellovibrio sp. HCB154]|uniref:YbaN family protein n=1 Tax=Pseudobdellovibrio sp. HCB154 TaxID=3386277 RepID=UPI003916F7BB
MSVVKNRFLRGLLFIGGIISVAVGFIGVFTPVLPTTPFVLLAAWCFLNSSEKAHRWIHDHRILGPPLKRWQKHRSIARSTKITATVMIVFSLTILWLKGPHLWLQIGVTLLLLGVSLFIWTRKEA